ncbi:hypothetical protein E2542_SST01251 [Spatholobus suberectus]|nr:hypothetical protein E2542_SST01251 [Spatholobus suberectus]
MSDSSMQLLRLLDENPVDEPQAQPRRNRNRVPRHNAPSRDSSPQSVSNSGTQHMKGLINNTGYVKGNGNGSVIFGTFDSSIRTYN